LAPPGDGIEGIRRRIDGLWHLDALHRGIDVLEPVARDKEDDLVARTEHPAVAKLGKGGGGSANTPAFSARSRWPSRISLSVTVSEAPPLSRMAIRASLALEGTETDIESAMVAGCLALAYWPVVT